MNTINPAILEKNGDLLKSAQEAEELNFNIQNFFTHIDPIKTLHLVIASIVFFIIYKLTVTAFNYVYNALHKIKSRNFFQLKFKKLILVSNDHISSVLDILFKIFKSFFFLFFIYSYLTYIFNLFESTKGIAVKLISYFTYIIVFFAKSIFSFIPNLLIILSIVLITYFVLEFTKIIVRGLYLQQIVFQGFKKAWISPTYQIFRFFIIAFALVMIFPYLPGSNSPAFQGVSVFLGVLISLGSSSAIANMIAGIVLIYMSPFSEGDKVKMGEITGVIQDMGLLVTRLKTIKNEDITIPNSIILAKEVINYSTSANSREKLIITIPIGLGYDVDLKTVDQLLINSCDIEDYILCDPKPFVLVKELSDYCINYELNAYIDNAEKLLLAKSNLQRNIIQNFKEAKVEILSPAHIDVKNKA